MKALMVLALALAWSFSTNAQTHDMFLVIGQSNAKGRGMETPTISVAPGAASEYSAGALPALTHPTGRCPQGQTCYWTSDSYGPMVAFASEWKQRTGKNSTYVFRAKGGTSLLQGADVGGSGNWSDYEQPLYKNAINEFFAALDAQAGLYWGVDKIYVVWIQGESDAINGIDQSRYAQALLSLFQKLDDDLYARLYRRIDGFLIAETGYFFGYTEGATGAASPAQNQAHRDRIEPIALAQQQSELFTINGAQKVVLASNLARLRMSPCVNGASAIGCGGRAPDSGDRIHYSTQTYEQLGIEMARNGAIFRASGVKPLSQNCVSSSACSPGKLIYRWFNPAQGIHVSSSGATDFNINGVDPSQSFEFKGARLRLFHSSGPGRLPLYRLRNNATGAYMESTSATEGAPAYEGATLLGYCSATSSPDQTPVAITRFRLGNNRVSTMDPLEAQAWSSGGWVNEGVLCYTR